MHRLLTAFFFFQIATLAYNIGQSSVQKEYLFDAIGPAEGFPSGQAICIGKDSKGYLWIGTESGLLRFDGHRFKRYIHTPGELNSLPSNYIRHLTVDKHDRIWLDAGGVLTIFDTHQNFIYTPTLQNSHPRFISFHYVKSSDQMYILTYTNLYTNAGYNICPEAHPLLGIKERSFRTFSIDTDGHFWFGTDYALLHYQPQQCVSHTYSFFCDKKSDCFEGHIASYIDKQGILWLGNWTKGLLSFHTLHKTFRHFTWSKNPDIQQAILSIGSDPSDDGMLWVATSDGIQQFDTERLTFHSYAGEYGDRTRICGSGFGLFQDGKNMWFGTNKGLFTQNDIKQSIQAIPLDLDEVNKRLHVEQLHITPSGNSDSIAYILFRYGSLIAYDLVGRREIQLPYQIRRFCRRESSPLAFLISKNGTWYISSEKYGVVVWDPHKNMLFPAHPTLSRSEKVLSFSEDEKGLVHACSAGASYRISSSGMLIKNMDLSQFLQARNQYYFLQGPYFDSANNQWFIVKQNGNDALLLLSKITNQIHLFSAETHMEFQQIQEINDLCPLKDSTMAIASYNGFCIAKWNGRTLQFDCTEKYNGRPLGVINTLRNTDNTLWCSSDIGVFWYNIRSRVLSTLSYYNSKMGPSPQPGIFLSPTSKLIYVGQQGYLNIINPILFKKLSRNRISLTEMTVNDKEIYPLPSSRDVLSFSYKDKAITFYFSNLNFINAKEAEYRYRSDGDTIWRMMDGNRLSFEEIASGKHVYSVQSIDGMGKPSENTYTLSFIVSTVYYKSWWFYVLLSFGVLFVIYLFFRNREIERQKMDSLRYRIARDLHDDMGSHLSQIRMMSELESRKTQNTTTQKIADKLGEVMQNMSEIVWSINPAYDNINDVVMRVVEFAIETLEPQGIDFRFDIDELPSDSKMSPEIRRHFYLIFKEAIHNISKYAHARQVSLSIQRMDKKLCARIKDDGIGFEPALVKMGNGLKNMESRAKTINGILTIETGENGSTIQIVF